MEIKSVPPLVAPTRRHRLMANPFMIPPKILISSTSDVIAIPGITSVSTLVSTMQTQEYSVNFFPINRNPIYTGIAFNIMLINVYGREIPANSSAPLCTSNDSPVTPPGYRSPALTKVLMFNAISTEARHTTSKVFTSCFHSVFIGSLLFPFSCNVFSEFSLNKSFLPYFYLYFKSHNCHFSIVAPVISFESPFCRLTTNRMSLSSR